MNVSGLSELPINTAGKTAERILVVDDDPLICELLEQFLNGLGYQVSTAEDGRKGLFLYKAQPFDLVLTDVRMPGLSGLQLLQAVKGLTPRIPVVLISGYSETETVVAALKFGAENFLTKPLKMATLAKVVSQSLNLAGITPPEELHLNNISQTTRIQAPSRAELISEIVNQIALSAVAVGFATRDLGNNIKLALSEAITNAMEHGNGWDPAKLVTVSVEVNPGFLQASIEDQGDGFDYQSLPDPTQPSLMLSERGRGVFLMHAIMDKVTYHNCGNLLVLRKLKQHDQP